MRDCYVIFFMDGGIDKVTTMSIEDYAEKHGYNVVPGRDHHGQLCRKDGYVPARSYVPTTLVE